MKNTFLFFLSFIFIACSSEPDLTFPESDEKVQTEVILEELTEETEEFDILEEEVVPLNYYQKAREKHPQKERLPSDVVLHNSDAIFDYTILNFEKILSTTKNWFLCKYIREEGEVGEEFYITFDYKGNQLDAILAIAFAEDLRGSVSFENDSVFVAIQLIDEIELSGDSFTVLSTSEEETRYKITSDGEINVVERYDLNEYNTIFEKLRGIEKYYAQTDLFRLHSLLKFKNDLRYKKLEKHLQEEYENPNFVTISLLDKNKGYIEFQTQNDVDTYFTLTYWNKTNGDKLIATTNKNCTMFCEGNISFLLYGHNSKSYISKQTSEIINEIDILKLQRPNGYIEGDGYDFEFRLPQKGLYIRYCVDKVCIDLIWKDGIFTS